MYDRNWVVFEETICQTLTSTRWFVIFESHRLWRLQDILDKITKWIWVQSRIRTSKRSDECSKFRRNRSRIRRMIAFGISTIEWNTIPWMRTILLHDRAVNLSKARCSTFAPIRYFVKVKWMNIIFNQKKFRSNNIEWFTKFLEYCEMKGVHGETVEFGWTLSPGHKTLQLLREIPRTMAENRIQPEQFGDRAIFMWMYIDIDWTNAEHKENDIFVFFRS